MLNIDFGSSNSSQIPAAKVITSKEGFLNTVYVHPKDLVSLWHMFNDIRNMRKDEIDTVMNDIKDLNEEWNK